MALESSGPGLQSIREQLSLARQGLGESVDHLISQAGTDEHHSGAASFNMLMQAGVVIGGWLMAKAALKAQEQLDAGNADITFLDGKIKTARFFAAHVLPRAQGYRAIALAGSDAVMDVTEEQL